MTLRSAARSLALFFAPCLALAALVGPAAAGHCTHCPKTTFCRPKAPCIKYKCVCPKPICDCGSLEHFGYYPTCWSAWPFPPDYSHCPSPPTAVAAPCAPNGAPNPLGQLPSPHPLPALQ